MGYDYAKEAKAEAAQTEAEVAVKDQWSRLEIHHNYLFVKVFENKELCRSLLEALLGKKIKDLAYPHAEKVIEPRPDRKSIRLDICVTTARGRFTT